MKYFWFYYFSLKRLCAGGPAILVSIALCDQTSAATLFSFSGSNAQFYVNDMRCFVEAGSFRGSMAMVSSLAKIDEQNPMALQNQMDNG